MDLKGCTAIVTGGSGGLGRRICRALALNGVNVVVNYAASEANAKSVAEEISKLGVHAVAIPADVTDPADVARMVEQTQAEFGRVEILVNDAAFRPGTKNPFEFATSRRKAIIGRVRSAETLYHTHPDAAAARAWGPYD